VSAIGRYEAELYSYLEAKHEGLLQGIRTKGVLDDGTVSEMDRALGDFGKVFAA
jgi:F-type H+-transporting ATPase subunit alpha